jgi:hypothetical protein
MRPSLVIAALVLAAASAAQAGEPLSARERGWLAAGMPVVHAARARGLPLDIVVQPTDQPDASPIALGIARDRCQLVLSMRGNPGADALVESVPPEGFDAIVEAVFAHEIGHCWRWTQGVWHALPAGFADAPDDPADVHEPEALAAMRRAMRETRREEGYADLVGLAWTRRAHPAHYAQVLEWLERFRDDALPGDHHDTGPWLRLVADPAAFGAEPDPFRAAQPLWERGLRAAD